ncbi:c-type cytochrome [Haloferula sp. BvORR071]|uniref:DUF7133 domain-containing protein n=1 Tax=Haloferula sp. BvORR071 TaxID=1396141 RepID=UPI000551F1F8|nr:c-type cytochrome [Haloferula sp. BvORR071]
MKNPAFLLFLFLASSAHAETARWADSSLPIKDGLELWFDASRENEAREAHYMNRLAEGQHMELWHDSSGHSRHLAQWSSSARPEWRHGAVFFDGDDYLAALLTPGIQAKNATIFIVAAPDRAAGDFPAFLSTARRDENDYTSGFCIDLGREASPQGTMHYLNVEGAGQFKETNLLVAPLSIEHGHLFSVTSAPGGTRVRADGKDQGRRDRGDVAFLADRLAVGARFVEPEMRHFFHGAIAEILVFDRKLEDPELTRIEAWLSAKHAAFLDPAAPHESTLVPDKNAPEVQMLVPGFRVDELPIKVTNLNNIEYAPDGRLFAGGYDGRFHLLRDTNGDGLEDKLDTFAPDSSDNYPVGMVVKDGMPHALLADEIVRFRDTNGDGIPDKRETVAKGWDDPTLQNDPLLMHRRVDSAMAITTGPDDSWYITMGSANPGNGYWQKAEGDVWAPDAVKTGAPLYSPAKRRGCLLHISKDGKVEQLASGLRYIMSLQWDQRGELFGTDQEGATWLPNGNPFDELLHLQTGRHYGFPPRHPKLLPDVVDEPSVWNFAPQHQSTCGFRFNGPAKDRPRFGPEFWAHDAIVTGESRGKLWRTSLAPTAAGYVANTQLFAAVGLLITDCAISPQGDLVICCHSGPPDWGKGPASEGKLFKIRYVDPAAAQPVLTWASDERTTVVEFDRPLPPETARDLTARLHMECGPCVSAADRFEAIRPGYAVVRAQMGQARYNVPIVSAKLAPDLRSLVITTAPRSKAFGYALTLDTPRREPGLKQVDAIDLAYTLNGLDAAWEGAKGSAWGGRLPHPDFGVVRELSRGSASQAEGLSHLAEQGMLKLRTRLDLSHMLQPATQPGSKLDYTPAPEVITITLKSDVPLELAGPGLEVRGNGTTETSFTRTISGDPRQDLSISLPTPATKLEVNFHTAIDPRPRALGTGRFLMPFAKAPEEIQIKQTVVPEIAGGDRERGRQLFLGKAACFTCHQFNGEGHAVGPDLSNTVHRDYAVVLRDIQDPSATINPDAVAYQIELKDGSAVAGVRIGETASTLKLAMPGGNVSLVNKSDIKATTVLPGSLMPPVCSAR